MPEGWSGDLIYTVNGTQNDLPTSLTLVPIADAGQQKKAEYQAVFGDFKLATQATH